MRSCTECPRTFEPYRGLQLVCSLECRRARNNRSERLRTGLEGQTYLCTVCQQSFSPIRRNQVRCSAECTKVQNSRRTNNYNKTHAVERAAYQREYETRPTSRKRKAIREAVYSQTAQYQKRKAQYATSQRGKAVHRRASAKRRALKKGATISDDMPTIHALSNYQKGRCANCGQKLSRAAHIDHIMPLALGGPHARVNAQALCQSCNQRKHAKHPLVFAREEGRLL